MNDLNRDELIYLSAMIDLDASINIARSKPKGKSVFFAPVIWIANAMPVLNEWRERTGIGAIVKQGNTFKWCISGRIAFELLKVVYPFSRAKQNEADVIFELVDTIDSSSNHGGTPIEIIEKRQALFDRLKEIHRENSNRGQWRLGAVRGTDE